MLLFNVYIADISQKPISKSLPVLRYKLSKNIAYVINFSNFSEKRMNQK